MKTNTTQRFSRFHIFPVLVMALLLVAGGMVFGQDTYKLGPKDFHAFKLANKHHYAGVQSYKKKKYDKAAKAFVKCLKTFPKYSSADYYLAKIFYNKGDLKKAMAHMEMSKKNYKYMNDLVVDTKLEYHKTLRRQRENLQADLANTMLSMTPSHRSEMEKKVQNIDNILKKPIVEAEKMPADYFFLHGNIFFKMKKLKEAHDQYLQALKTDDRHTDTYNNLISLYYMAKQYDRAYEFVKKAIANDINLNPKLKAAVLQQVLGKKK
jgi:tetratricopeptide (TPR) repeat protein